MGIGVGQMLNDLPYFYVDRWYFGKIKRIEAEKKLLLPDNEHGAFLVRDSESRRNDYSLSGNWIFNQSMLIIIVTFPVEIVNKEYCCRCR